MGSCRLLLLLFAAVLLVHGKKCPKKPALYQWDVNSAALGIPVSLTMTHLDKELANKPDDFIECFKKQYSAYPDQGQYSWTDTVFGRKKRDLSTSMIMFDQTQEGYVEIPFMVEANFSECNQRRIALALRKLETKTCVKFVPFMGVGAHQADGMVPGGYIKSVEHEIMHVLGFVHVQDSPYRAGPQSWWEKTFYPVAARTKDKVEEIAPWERNSALSYVGGDKTLTDWDTYKINQVYKCKHTAYGNRKIDMNHKPEDVVNSFTDDPTLWG